FPLQNLENGEPEYFKIQREGNVINIINIQFKSLRPANRISPVYLCPTGYAWPYFMSSVLRWRIQRNILKQKRARANQAHITLEYINQLRQFVNRQFS